MRFVACSFTSGGGRRLYTYHAVIDEPLAVGDVVKVPVPRATDGSWQRAIVEAVDLPEPSFPTKPVLGLLETAAARAERKAAGNGDAA